MIEDRIVFHFRDGFHNSGNDTDAPDGAMVSTSKNILFTRERKPVSFRSTSNTYTKGGSRATVLDKNLVGFLGTSATDATGNILQGVGKSLWFVGNTIAGGVQVVDHSTGNNVQIGGANTADLSPTPQFCKWNGSSWDAPLEVGVAEPTASSSLALVAESASGFSVWTGSIKGSVSVRVARKRLGSIGIASPPSNVVTGDPVLGNSVTIDIPTMPADGSKVSDNSWVLYFTYKGQGSLSAHFTFPIEITEEQIGGVEDDLVTPVAIVQTDKGKNCRAKVVSQSTTTQTSRVVEVEFQDNDLLLLNPFENYYPPEACKFLVKVGNTMCAIGTGTDGTGVDVSYPNQYEAFPPEWRDWLTEAPVGITQEPDLGFFWVAGPTSIYLATWTGVTTNESPIRLVQRSNRFGIIGENACLSVNGVFYGLTAGKTPIRVFPDGRVDTIFGRKVLNQFSGWDEDTKLGYDEATNTVYYAKSSLTSGKDEVIGFQVDHEIWTAPITPLVSSVIKSMFSINGRMYLCTDDTGLKTSMWDTTGNSDWVAISKFVLGKYAYAIKDIIQVKMLLSVEDKVALITWTAYRNEDYTNSDVIATYTPTANKRVITERQFTESLDYESVALGVSGSSGGNTPYYTELIFDVHQIDHRD